MTGNLSSLPKTRFLLDESLDPAVSKALNLVGYQFAETPKGTKDPDIIEWCRENEVLWIHADDRARKQHRSQLLTSGIRTIWVFRKGGRMTGMEQLRILSYVLPQFFKAQVDQPRERHFRASAVNELSKPGFRRAPP